MATLFLSLLLWYVRAALLLVVAWGLLGLLRRQGRLSPAGLSRLSRALVGAALLLPLLTSSAGPGATAAASGVTAPIQVFYELGTGTVAQFQPPLQGAGLPTLRVPLWWTLLPLGVVLALGLGVGAWLWRSYRALRQQVEAARPLRRVGRVEVRAGPEAFAAALPGRAVVLLPPDAPDREAALLHELTHHRRRDPQFAWVLIGLVGLFCWHPAAWGLRRQLSELDEEACDDVLRRRLGARRYGSALLSMAEARVASAPLAASMARSTPLLYQRIEMLTLPPRSQSALPAALLCALALSMTAWATGGDLAEDRRLQPAELADILSRVPELDAVGVPADAGVTATVNHLLARPGLRRFLHDGLEQRAQWQPLVDSALRRYDLPLALAAVPLTESGYRNLGASAAGGEMDSLAPGIPGRGLWMFIPETARTYGLTVTDARDDRLDPRAETDAAMRLLSDLYAEFGDWPLALAGYNQGAPHVREAIQVGGTEDAWALRRAGLLNEYLDHMTVAWVALGAPDLTR